MAVKKANQDCWVGADCPPQHSCTNGKCVPWPKKPGILGNTSAKIGAGLIGAGLAAIGTKVAKNIKENKPVRQAKRAAKKNEDLIAKKRGGMVAKRTTTKRK